MSAPSTASPLTLLRRPSRTFAVDLLTSYGVNIARAGAMLAIVALLGHYTPTYYLAGFLFLRSMVGLLNNLFAGAQPASIAAVPARSPVVAIPIEFTSDEPVSGSGSTTLEYRRPAPMGRRPTSGFDGVFVGSAVPAIAAFFVVSCTVPYLRDALRTVLPPSRDWTVAGFTISFAAGLLLRLQSDAAGGILQTRRLLWLDNILVSLAEIGWIVLALSHHRELWRDLFVAVGVAHLSSGLALWFARWLIAAALLIDFREFTFSFRFDIALRFLSVAGLLAFASLGDFLYAPLNNIIINRKLDPLLIADYGPALQVDSLLLLAVSGIASVMLPRVVALYAQRNFAELRHSYIVSMVVGTLLLAGGAGLFLTFSGPILRVWLGDVPPGMRAILPFVLTHTVLGGAGSISRAMFLGIGRFRAWTISSLAGGLCNVFFAYTFAVTFGWGLRGIVFSTIFIVTLKNAIWMPWYLLRALRSPDGVQRASITADSRTDPAPPPA